MYISHENELYLVFSSGEIFKSVEVDEIGFQPYNMINENIRKVCTGTGFEAIVTESNKLLTTFSEKSSARSTNGYIKIPRELKKFANLDIIDVVSGSNHMLVHAVQKGSCSQNTSPENSSINDFDGSCVDKIKVNEMNDLNRTYTKLQQELNNDHQSVIEEDEGDENDNDNQNQLKNDDKKTDNGYNVTTTSTGISKIPISGQMMAKRRSSNNSNGSSLSTSRKNSDEGSTAHVVINTQKECEEIDKNLNEIVPGTIEKSLSLKEFESLEKEHAATDSSNENEVKLVNVEEVDERVSSTSADSHKTYAGENNVAGAQEKEPISGEFLIASQTPPHWIKTPPPGNVVTTPISMSDEETDDVDNVIENRLNKEEQLQVILQQTEEGTSIAEIRRQSTDENPPAAMLLTPNLKRIDSEITFINDGVDVTEEIENMNENNSEPEDEQQTNKQPTIVDSILGEKLLLNFVVQPIMDTKEETKKALEEVFETKSPFKENGGGDSERTTASISSISPDKLHPITNGNGSTTSLKTTSNAKKNGKVRTFINDLKTKGRNMSCSNSNSVAVVTDSKLNFRKIIIIRFI